VINGDLSDDVVFLRQLIIDGQVPYQTLVPCFVLDGSGSQISDPDHNMIFEKVGKI